MARIVVGVEYSNCREGSLVRVSLMSIPRTSVVFPAAWAGTDTARLATTAIRTTIAGTAVLRSIERIIGVSSARSE
jgi:hypothetical protein